MPDELPPDEPAPGADPPPPWTNDPVTGPGRPTTGRITRSRRDSATLCVLVLAAACVGLALTIRSGRADSAMLFVGLPTLLALAIVLSPPARSVHAMTFKGLSLALLMTAVVLHEGAICVLLAAPLVYAVGHTVVALLSLPRRGSRAIVPLALVLSLEGLAPGLRVTPEQAVTVTRTVIASPTEVAARVTAGPDLRGTPAGLPLSAMPLPTHATGSGVDTGDRWVFDFPGDSHGSGGALTTEITESSLTGTGGHVVFHPITDTSIVARWLDWTSASLDWHSTGPGTSVTLTVHFTRGLDPSWYFGPLDDLIVAGAASHLLDALGLGLTSSRDLSPTPLHGPGHQ